MELEFTAYFLNSVRKRRPDIEFEYIRRVIMHSFHEELQDDGRVRYYGYISEKDRYLRVVEEPSGKIHNAMWDDDFKRTWERENK